jgi:pimeloyl-ACP methyl ester carboxylesterase
MPACNFPTKFNATWHPEISDLKPEEASNWNTAKKVAYNVISVAIPIILIIRIISWVFNKYARGHVIPSSNLSVETKNRMKADFEKIWKSAPLANDYIRTPISITTADGVKLSGTHFQHVSAGSNTPTVLLFQPNAVPREYSSWWQWMPLYCHNRNSACNFVTFDYRGTGDSEGFVEKSSDLILDGDAALQFVSKHLYVRNENLIVYGFSLGGAISAEAIARNPWFKGRYVNDRSIWSVCRLVRSHLPWTGRLISKMAEWHLWDLDAIEATRKMDAKKFVLFNKDDNVTKYRASYAKGLEKNPPLKTNTTFVELETPYFASAHTTPMDYCHTLNGDVPVHRIMQFIAPDSLYSRSSARADAG